MARAGVLLRWRRFAALAGFAAVLAVEASSPASAQNLLESLFGGIRRAFTPRLQSYDPNHDMREGGPSSGYCVRLCDGRYFPVSGRGKMNASEMCRAFCPHAPTQLFSGGNIATAVAPNGQRYSNLPNAFLYRDKFVADCSCTGKGPLGLVPFDDVEDPTLRNGDIVATESGLMSFRSDGRQAEFVPAASMPGLSAKMKEQLTQTRVAPGPDAAPQPPAPQAAPARPPVNQRAQALR